MILGFKQQFIPKILDGTKIHTIRAGNRWRSGMKIHFYTNVRTKGMYAFREDATAKEVNKIRIRWVPEAFRVFINDYMLSGPAKEALAKKDGFDSLDDFKKWFNKDFEGQIIYWK